MDSGRFFFNAPHRGNMLILGNVDPIFRGPAGSLVSMELESSKRRPFLLSSPDDLTIEEEYYDEQLPEKKRRLTSEQVYLLEKSFEVENKLEPERKTQLAKKLGLQPRQVAVWFQNRRARWKTKQLEKDYDLLKADYDSLVSNYDALLNHNNYLKSQVVFLTEKLQAKVEDGVAAEMGLVAGNQASDPELPGQAADDPDVHVKVKGEDHLSSVGSAEVDDDNGPQIVDSGHSYFGGANDEYHGCMGQVAEEDYVDGRDEFSEVFAVGGEQPQLGLWGWS